MSNKILDLIKNNDIIVPNILFKNYRKLNITDSELIIIIYFINIKDTIYNPVLLSENMSIPVDEIISITNSLAEKGLIQISLKKIKSLNAEVIELDTLYNKLLNMIIESNEIDNNIFTYIEQKFGRTLSPMEYEIVNSWSNYPEKHIYKAIDETVSKGIVSIKYIDKILLEWSKNGFKDNVDKRDYKIVDTSMIDYDWLNDN